MIELSIAFVLHLFTSVDYNGVGPHVRYSGEQFIAGVFLNSHSRPTLYAGRRYEWGNVWAEVAAVTGYRYAVAPLGRVGVDLSRHASLFAAPMYDGDGTALIVGVEFRAQPRR